jgi:hypothetical protein
MKNIKVKGWVRTPDKEMNTVDYDKSITNDLKVTVIFDDFDNSYVVKTTDTGTYENDSREKLFGSFENNKASIVEILEKAEKVNHFSHNPNLFI